MARGREGRLTRTATLVPGGRLSLRHLGRLRTSQPHHQLDGLRRSPDLDLRSRRPERDHGRGHHPRQPGLPGIHTRRARRGLLPAEHLVDAGYASCPTWNKPSVNTRSPSQGRCRAIPPVNTARTRTSPRTSSTSTHDLRQVTCPQGQVSQGWHGPYPTSSPTAAPLIVARFTKSQRRPCPVRSRCTSTTDSARTLGFPPRELRDLELRVGTEQQTLEWKTRYAVRSGVEGTVNEFATDTECAAAITEDRESRTSSTF